VTTTRFLLDTHALLWMLAEPDRLGATFRSLLTDPDNEVLFSAASIWEIAIRAGRRQANFHVRPERIAREAERIGLVELPVTASVASRVAGHGPLA
jgi:PIN domain nuclease of toxin-antitoxin system